MTTIASRDFDRVARAIERLTIDSDGEPPLAELAAAAGLSPFHFQRLFKRWAGVTPKRLHQVAALGRAKASLRQGRSVLDAAYDAGLSGPGRLHDLFVACEAMTPGEYRTAGRDLRIAYGFHDSPFGECLVMVTERGLCGLGFVSGAGEPAHQETLADLTNQWRQATMTENPTRTRPFAERIFGKTNDRERIPVLLKGTNLQIKVWEALLRIPEGETRTYAAIAAAVGKPKAARAVGNAVAANPISWLIPCHRVIRGTGVIDHYRWGSSRKRAMLAWEAVQTTAP
ncbi:MAG: methylated-DNA--[protein]-cysteine S-methyltransferase [Alphaproteobacteria bacterium]|nr:methylated-DNA--[protein]-cysteine S-methyltransferase [Alphaproteobacteria bacterium]